MYRPPTPDAEFIELFNNSSSSVFDLSNFRLNGADFTFAPGTIILPNGFVVIAKDRTVFGATYGGSIPIAGVFAGRLDNGGETLTLLEPGPTADQEIVVARVRYDNVPPWPALADGTGASLQLIDPRQDNNRVGNWAAVDANNGLDPATPGAPNNVLAALPPFPPLWLNEVQPDNLNTVADRMGDFDPWVEVYNAGDSALDLSAYFLSDDYSNLTQWPFPPGARINPGQLLLVWLDGEPAEGTATEFHAGFRLPSGSGSVVLSRLVNDQPQVVDYLNYNQVSPGRSFGRYPDGQKGDLQPFDYPSPGATNNAISRPVTLWINEWMAANTHTLTNPAGGGFDDWFELFNPGANAVDLTGYRLTDNLTNAANFIIPAGKIIEPGAFLMVWADSSPGQNGTNRAELHTNFKLSQDGEAIGLFAPDGTLIDAVVFGPQSDDVSQGRWPDGDRGGFYFFTRPTPGISNVLPTSRYAPVLGPIGDKSVALGSPLRFQVLATDADVPPQILTYSLGTNAPPGASLDSAGGLFSWTPTEGTGTYPVTIRVTDNGSPRLGDEATIRITVTKPGSFPITAVTVSPAGSIKVEWAGDTGKTYQVQYKSDLNEPSWQNLGGPITNSPAASFTEAIGSHAQRFYRIIAF